jgi:hypothetical protein
VTPKMPARAADNSAKPNFLPIDFMKNFPTRLVKKHRPHWKLAKAHDRYLQMSGADTACNGRFILRTGGRPVRRP